MNMMRSNQSPWHGRLVHVFPTLGTVARAKHSGWATLTFLTLLMLVVSGCAEKTPPYGTETRLSLVNSRHKTWAVCPAINLSGEEGVDPILQADILYQQLQQVGGITAIPVNRVVEVFANLGIQNVRSEEQAAQVCELLGCDALLVPTVTIYDPFNPPKLGASLSLMRRFSAGEAAKVEPERLIRSASPQGQAAMPTPSSAIVQVVGMFDASNGSTRDALWQYAAGRNDPVGPFGEREYLMSMDRYNGFVYHQLLADLLASPKLKGS